ncbi:AsmA family protein [Blastochloris sulfoviridis]|uniref:AsmA family protein n=1 Tax=Blastochloris sulfoviridis TaxID=50712 RepID=A0A5M6I2W9_9HYPH|nr:AsmA-like C-terminal region-containing protein [Blastochloris sulfoviridis]KAA5602513.1 AsmA family protein [Blastochloris sulfoviridis]
MTARSLAKSVAFALAGFAGVLVVGAVVLRVAVSNQDVHAAVFSALGRDAGRSFAAGNLRVVAWPRPAALFEDVAMRGEGPATFTAPSLTATLKLLPLLSGRVEVDELVLDQPEITWSVAGGPLVPAAPGGSAPDIRINGGRIDIDGPDGAIERLEDVTAEIEHGSTAITLSGTMRLRDEPIEAYLSIGDAAAFARGARSAVRFKMTAPAATLAFDGHAVFNRTLQLEGAVAADSSALRTALAWFDLDPVVRGGLGRFALKGDLAVSGRQFALRDASLELDGNRAEGGLTVRFENGQPIVQGTLAAETLTLTPYIVDVAPRRTGGWNSDRFDTSALTAANADIRLSAGRIVFGQASLGHAAGAVLLRGGRLSLTLGEAEAFDGMLRGTLELASNPEGVELRVDAVASDIDLDRFGQTLFGARRFEGRGALVVGLAGQGASPAAMARSLTGEVKVNAGAGALTGVNIEQILRRIEKRPLAGTGDLRGGRTAFNRLAVQVRVTDGVATCDDVVMEGPAVRVVVFGTASVGERTLDLKGNAGLVRAAGAGFELPFIIRGPWDSPSVVPDAESLIRRSGAAAPLLERAVRRDEPAAAGPSTAANGAVPAVEGAGGLASDTP